MARIELCVHVDPNDVVTITHFPSFVTSMGNPSPFVSLAFSKGGALYFDDFAQLQKFNSQINEILSDKSWETITEDKSEAEIK